MFYDISMGDVLSWTGVGPHDCQVMHMYMVFEGNFSLRGRIKRIKTEEKA